MSNDITRVTAPALPSATQTYNHLSQANYTNILRLFFRRLTTVVTNLLTLEGGGGGKFLYFPVGAFSSTSTQTAAVINTAYAVTLDTTVESSDIAIESSSQIHVENDGVYRVSVALQGEAPSGTGGRLRVWLQVTGTNLASSGREYELDGLLSVKCEFTLTLLSTDYVQVMWAKDNADINLLATSAAGIYPAIPSASVSVDYVSNS
tara:strand:- start:1116 stop:1733 length:618 start_codon:yes stop_codon:yes gene_type:complete